MPVLTALLQYKCMDFEVDFFAFEGCHDIAFDEVGIVFFIVTNCNCYHVAYPFSALFMIIAENGK